MIALKCPSCGSDISFDDSREFGFCSYCGTKLQLVSQVKVSHTFEDTLQAELEIVKRLLAANLEFVVGGNGGSPTVLPAKKGFRVYQIVGGDNLTKIAKKFNTTVDYLFGINDTIKDKNFVRASFYMYVPEN